MAGVINHTARQFNLKAAGDKGNVVVRLKPGFNVVPDEHWKVVAGIDFTKALKADGKIDFGAIVDKKQDTEGADPSAKAQSKVVATPKEKK